MNKLLLMIWWNDDIQTYHMASHDEIRLFCNGYYSEILVMDASTLDIIYTLTSRVNPDWISAMHVIRPAKRQGLFDHEIFLWISYWLSIYADDVVIGLSISGVVKVWTLTGNETRSSEPIYEDESKPVRCLNALKLTCCIYNLRTVLIVCTKYWQVNIFLHFLLANNLYRH